MVVLTYVFGSSDPWFVIFSLISVLCLVLCCDIYRSTLISIMYPACMITVHDRKSRALHPPSLDLSVNVSTSLESEVSINRIRTRSIKVSHQIQASSTATST